MSHALKPSLSANRHPSYVPLELSEPHLMTRAEMILVNFVVASVLELMNCAGGSLFAQVDGSKRRGVFVEFGWTDHGERLPRYVPCAYEGETRCDTDPSCLCRRFCRGLTEQQKEQIVPIIIDSLGF